MNRIAVLLVLAASPTWAAAPSNAVRTSLRVDCPLLVTQLPGPKKGTVPFFGPLKKGTGTTTDSGSLLGQVQAVVEPVPFFNGREGYGDGARIVLVAPDGSSRVLTEGFHSAADPDVGFDGTNFLFAGKRSAADVWNIFEMSLDDGQVRQITRDAGNCRSPVYQSTLYTLDSPEPWYQVTFVSDAAGTRNDDGSGPAVHLYSCKLDGSREKGDRPLLPERPEGCYAQKGSVPFFSTVRRLTYNVSSDFDPFLMADGRLLFASWQRSTLAREKGDGPLLPERPEGCFAQKGSVPFFSGMETATGRIRLFGVNLDGTDYALFADPAGPAIHHMPCITPSGLVVFVAADRVPWDGAGQLASVSYRRPLNSFRMLSEPGDGLFHSPSPLPDGAVVVARRPADGTGTHAVGRFDPATGQWQAVFDDPDWHDIQPRSVYRRAPADGRSSVVNEEKPNGKLYCLNVYETDLARSDWLPPGSVKRVRVLEGIPAAFAAEDSARPAGDLTAAALAGDRPALVPRRILGEAEVSEDGSFHVEVPANTPLELQTLDADGLALRACGWIWVKNHENRGCIGCHEDGELSPDNRFADALALSAAPLAPPEAQRRTVDFRRDLMPIIQTKCVPCHGGAARKTGQAPRDQQALPDVRRAGSEPVPFSRSQETGQAEPNLDGSFQVLRRYVQPGQARTSPLIWHIFGRNTSQPWDGAATEKPFKPIPPGQVEPLSSQERQTFVEWIDLGAHGLE
jgi:hypothetical protein